MSKYWLSKLILSLFTIGTIILLTVLRKEQVVETKSVSLIDTLNKLVDSYNLEVLDERVVDGITADSIECANLDFKMNKLDQEIAYLLDESAKWYSKSLVFRKSADNLSEKAALIKSDSFLNRADELDEELTKTLNEYLSYRYSSPDDKIRVVRYTYTDKDGCDRMTAEILLTNEYSKYERQQILAN